MEKVSMDEFPKPEILRVPLEQVSLSAKLMNEDEDVKVRASMQHISYPLRSS
jgi:HrpA-like RNA helicase